MLLRQTTWQCPYTYTLTEHTRRRTLQDGRKPEFKERRPPAARSRSKEPGVIQDARILVVDDNPDVLSAARLLLKQHFSDVRTLAHPGPLIELARTGAFDVL